MLPDVVTLKSDLSLFCFKTTTNHLLILTLSLIFLRMKYTKHIIAKTYSG